MTKQDLEQKLKELQQEYELKKKEIMRQYCDANKPLLQRVNLVAYILELN